jgi:hypothetical protein
MDFAPSFFDRKLLVAFLSSLLMLINLLHTKHTAHFSSLEQSVLRGTAGRKEDVKVSCAIYISKRSRILVRQQLLFSPSYNGQMIN